MQITLSINGKTYRADTSRAHDIARALDFSGDAPAAFGADAPHMTPFRTDGFTGDVRAGGSCNCELYTFSPHLHGTHTECVGHIARERIAVTAVIRDTLVPATMVTVTPEKAGESYDPPLAPGDMTITRTALEQALSAADPDFLTALIVRTHSRDLENPPFFSSAAMAYIAGLPVVHLLTDLPSVDRRDDGGRLSNHRVFWGVAPGETNIATPSPRTITEMIAAPPAIPDGRWLLDLQVAPFSCDAAPARPLLYEVKP